MIFFSNEDKSYNDQMKLLLLCKVCVCVVCGVVCVFITQSMVVRICWYTFFAAITGSPAAHFPPPPLPPFLDVVFEEEEEEEFVVGVGNIFRPESLS